MKTCFLIGSLALAAVSSAQADDWVSVLRTDRPGTEVFVDVSSIRASRGNPQVWWKLVTKPHTNHGTKPIAGKWLSHTLTRSTFNCETEDGIGDATVDYFEDGTLVNPDTNRDGAKWGPVAPNTPTSAVMHFVCNKTALEK